MNTPTSKKQSISVVRITLVLVVVIPVLAIAWSSIREQVAYTAFRKEITRVQELSTIKPSAIDCHDVEFAPECYATYDGLGFQQAKDMIIRSGYVFDNLSSKNARNTATNTSVYIETGDKSTPTVIAYKAINVT